MQITYKAANSFICKVAAALYFLYAGELVLLHVTASLYPQFVKQKQKRVSHESTGTLMAIKYNYVVVINTLQK